MDGCEILSNTNLDCHKVMPGIVVNIHDTIQISDGKKHQIGFLIRDQLMKTPQVPTTPKDT